MGFFNPKRDETTGDLTRQLNELRRMIEEVMNSKIVGIEKSIEVLSKKLERITPQPISEETLIRIDELIMRAEKASSSLSTIRGYETSLISMQEGIHDLVDVLEKERKMVREEIETYVRERNDLEKLREELKVWRKEIDEKESTFRNLKETVQELEMRKEKLEQESRDLQAGFLGSLEEAKNRLGEETKKLDRTFKFRELRQERLINKEKELEESVARFQEREQSLRGVEERFNQLVAEIAKLEDQKKNLQNDIAGLQEARNRLERLVGEIRGALLKP